MKITNFEFKARVADASVFEEKLCRLNPRYIGEDHQTDTYFEVPQGRLKLREGNIETALIYYERDNISGARKSDVLLYKHRQVEPLKKILSKLHAVKAVVVKQRRIYFIDNVKFHFDVVEGLGEFIEVEAIDETGSIGPDKLEAQCREFADFFGIAEDGFEVCSYSDLLMAAEH